MLFSMTDFMTPGPREATTASNIPTDVPLRLPTINSRTLLPEERFSGCSTIPAGRRTTFDALDSWSKLILPMTDRESLDADILIVGALIEEVNTLREGWLGAVGMRMVN